MCAVAAAFLESSHRGPFKCHPQSSVLARFHATLAAIGSAQSCMRRRLMMVSTVYWSIGIRRHRLVRSTAKIKIPLAQRPQETSIIQALIWVIVMGYTFISRWER
jgi:hypothetical protein